MKPPSDILPLELDRVSVEAADGSTLLDEVTIRIERGSRTVVLGPNGAGKSLLLRLCHGLIAPTRGAIRWRGDAAAADPSAIRRRQAMVFQRPVVLRRSVAANLRFPLAVAGLPRGEIASRVEEALSRFGLASLARRAGPVLSGGEQQRLALARAWALRPDVLFLDEPTSALDTAATRAVEEAIATFRGAGVKLVMTTHDLGQARRMADEIVFLNRGRVVEHGPADRFFASPATPEARAFLEGRIP